MNNATQNNHKVLVFSQFVKHLAIIKEYLEEQKISYAYLDGSTKDREEQLSGNYADKMEEIKDIISKRGMNFIGSSVQSLVKYIDETMKLSLNEVIYDFKKHEKAIKNANRDKKSELLNQLRELDLEKIDQAKHPQAIPNIIKFMEILDDDEIVMFVKEMVKSHVNAKLEVIEPYKSIAQHFRPVIEKIKTAIDSSK